MAGLLCALLRVPKSVQKYAKLKSLASSRESATTTSVVIQTSENAPFDAGASFTAGHREKA